MSNKIKNPLTGRMIKEGGATHKKMLKIKILPKKKIPKMLKIKILKKPKEKKKTPKMLKIKILKKPTEKKKEQLKTTPKIPEQKKDDTANTCIKKIDDFLISLYNPRKRNKDNFDKFKVLVDAVVSNDFYPTPPEYSQIIYDMVKKNYGGYNDIKIYDIAAGLGSLSLEFLKNPNMGGYTKIKNISMVEYNPIFAQEISCFEKIQTTNVKIIKGDFLKMDNPKFTKYDNAVYICNPPFRGAYNGKYEKELWVFFLVKILESFFNHRQTLYAILPPNAMLGERLRDKEILHNFEITNKTLLKKLGGMLGKDVSDGLNYSFEFISDVTGFKGLTKTGKTRNVPNMVLIRFF